MSIRKVTLSALGLASVVVRSIFTATPASAGAIGQNPDEFLLL